MAMDLHARRLIQSSLILGCALFSGCRWIPLQRSDSKLDSLQIPSPAANAVDHAPPPVPLDLTGSETQVSPKLQPLANSDQLAAEIPTATPLLDQAYTKAMIDAGVMKHGAPLQTAATTVRVRGGQNQVLDGPYAEAKEQLGGYYMIDVPTLDDALAWAARCPGAAFGSIEVRPIMEMPMPA